jgi:hypothetical protein
MKHLKLFEEHDRIAYSVVLKYRENKTTTHNENRFIFRKPRSLKEDEKDVIMDRLIHFTDVGCYVITSKIQKLLSVNIYSMDPNGHYYGGDMPIVIINNNLLDDLLSMISELEENGYQLNVFDQMAPSFHKLISRKYMNLKPNDFDEIIGCPFSLITLSFKKL